MERAVIICQGNELLPEHFASIGKMQQNGAYQSIPNLQSYDLRDIERQTIIKVLHMVHFNKAEAARLLNLDWNALYRRIRKYNIELPSGIA